MKGKQSIVRIANRLTCEPREKMNGRDVMSDDLLVNQLSEDITVIISEKSFASASELLEMRWLVGQRIVTDPQYEKRKKGQTSFLQHVAEDLTKRGFKWQERSLRYCVEFYEWEPSKFPNAFMKLNTQTKIPAWRDIVHLYLPSGNQKEKEKKVEEICRHCKIHCP